MKILLTNDDGYTAPGILALYHTLSRTHDVTLVAPDREKSAVGHGISLNRPLRLIPVRLPDRGDGWAVNGTPADCVKLALFELFNEPPDLVVAGINPGSNTGVNIDYSGTAAAAREAAFNDITGVAVSIEIGPAGHLDYQGMAAFIESFIPTLSSYTLSPGTFININCPDSRVGSTRGVKITRQARNNVSTGFAKKADPKGCSYFWYDRLSPCQAMEDTDIYALNHNYISISPLGIDTTDDHSLNRMADLDRLPAKLSIS
jgi:5'-nucleotidase